MGMFEFLGYGNAVFWVGLLIVVFLAGCEFFCNNIDVTLAKYKMFKFPQHLRLQKVCRILFLVTFVLALFAKIGVNWDTRTFSLGDEFILFMNVLLIYYVLCYTLVIVFLWMARLVWKCLFFLLRFMGYVLIWLQYETIAWINGK